MYKMKTMQFNCSTFGMCNFCFCVSATHLTFDQLHRLRFYNDYLYDYTVFTLLSFLADCSVIYACNHLL